MPTTTVSANPPRPPFVVDARVYWATVTYPTVVAIGRVLDPATPDLGQGPDGTIPVLSRGVIHHVAATALRLLPTPAAPAA